LGRKYGRGKYGASTYDLGFGGEIWLPETSPPASDVWVPEFVVPIPPAPIADVWNAVSNPPPDEIWIPINPPPDVWIPVT